MGERPQWKTEKYTNVNRAREKELLFFKII